MDLISFINPCILMFKVNCGENGFFSRYLTGYPSTL